MFELVSHLIHQRRSDIKSASKHQDFSKAHIKPWDPHYKRSNVVLNYPLNLLGFLLLRVKRRKMLQVRVHVPFELKWLGPSFEYPMQCERLSRTSALMVAAPQQVVQPDLEKGSQQTVQPVLEKPASSTCRACGRLDRVLESIHLGCRSARPMCLWCIKRSIGQALDQGLTYDIKCTDCGVTLSSADVGRVAGPDLNARSVGPTSFVLHIRSYSPCKGG